MDDSKSSSSSTSWHKIPCSRLELNLAKVLQNGQTFTWKQTSGGTWVNVIENSVYLLRQGQHPVQHQHEQQHEHDDRDDLEVEPQQQLHHRDAIVVEDHDTNTSYSHHDDQKNTGDHDNQADLYWQVVEVESERYENSEIEKVHDDHDEKKTKSCLDLCLRSRSNDVILNLADSKNGSQGKRRCKCSDEDSFANEPVAKTKKIVLEGQGACNAILSSTKSKALHYETVLKQYFQLDVNLTEIYTQCSKTDPNFAKKAKPFTGIRILRQDPTENLFSFICSSNNNIARITSMVNNMKQKFGRRLCTIDDIPIYTFPTCEVLAKPEVEQTLRKIGFGYRAKFIAKAAQQLHNEFPKNWLDSLRYASYRECVDGLTKLCGVGRKVADCVSLFSLDKHHVVPVDTHVLQIAIRDYKIPGIVKNTKSLTPAVHDKIGQFFFDLFGPYAGWAHTVLFTADLRQFNPEKSPKKMSEKPKAVK